MLNNLRSLIPKQSFEDQSEEENLIILCPQQIKRRFYITATKTCSMFVCFLKKGGNIWNQILRSILVTDMFQVKNFTLYTNMEKTSNLVPCCAKPVPAQRGYGGWVWKNKNNKKHVYVCVADRAGEPALSIGPSSVWIPQSCLWNPPTALQEDGGQVSIQPPTQDRNKAIKIDCVVR